jgi:hypothetical protein
MTHLGVPSTAPTAPPPPRDTSGIPGWVLVVATLVALSMVGALFYAVVGGGIGSGGSSGTPPAVARPQRHFPTHWDPRIAPYARIAARERGLQFTHPVPVRFLSPAAFTKSLKSDDQGMTKADRRQMEQTTGLLRAFGLLSGDVDLSEAVDDFSGSAVLAYYSFDDKRITVRGHRITASVKSTLVHELTHVLQDQHFHISARAEALQKLEKNGSGTSGADVLQALVEGDAERVERLYRDSLNPAEVRALDAARQAETDGATPALNRIPKIVVTLLTSPYTLGEGLTQTAAVDGGNSAVDRLLRHTPTHDAVLLDPLDAVTGHLRTLHVPAPALQPGEKKFDSGEFGALTLYLMLAARLSPVTALDAADGWAGDAYVGYQDGGRSCARMTFAGRTPTDTARMSDALRQWAAASSSTAHVTTAGGRVSVESCDPGTGIRSGNDDSDEAVTLVVVRTALGVGLLRAGIPDSTAGCLAGRLVETYPLTSLEDPAFGASDPEVQARVRDLAAECG